MRKLQILKQIAQEIEECQECKIGKSGQAVPGEGKIDAEIVFMGEAPGKQEAKVGRPFIGRSGQLLRSFIRSIGLKEEDVFITSPVKYLPDRGTPTPKDIAHGMIHTQKQLDLINPKVIVLLGSVAALAILGEKVPITKEHGKPIIKNGRTYFVTFHPAAALRFPPLKKLLEEDFREIKELAEAFSPHN